LSKRRRLWWRRIGGDIRIGIKGAQMKRKRKRNPITTLRNKGLRMWSLAVRKRAEGVCEVCGEKGYLNAHHIVGKEYLPLSLDILNGVALCPSHHKFNRMFSAHQNPIWFMKWLAEFRPKSLYYLGTYDFELEQINFLGGETFYKSRIKILEKEVKENGKEKQQTGTPGVKCTRSSR
jgi:hypothetical protein